MGLCGRACVCRPRLLPDLPPATSACGLANTPSASSSSLYTSTHILLCTHPCPFLSFLLPLLTLLSPSYPLFSPSPSSSSPPFPAIPSPRCSKRVPCYVSVGHRLALLQHHTHVLECLSGDGAGGGGEGQWRVCTAAEYQRRAGAGGGGGGGAQQHHHH